MTCFDVMDFWSLALSQQRNVTVRIFYEKVMSVAGLGIIYNIILSHVCEDFFCLKTIKSCTCLDDVFRK